MATLAEQLDALVAEHRLSSLTITRINKERGPSWAVYAQGDGLCASNGYERDKSVECHIRDAIDSLNALRAKPIVVPELAAAA